MTNTIHFQWVLKNGVESTARDYPKWKRLHGWYMRRYYGGE